MTHGVNRTKGKRICQPYFMTLYFICYYFTDILSLQLIHNLFNVLGVRNLLIGSVYFIL